MVKPFSPTELSARIRAALRKRLEPFEGEPSGPYAASGLGIDYARRRVTVYGEPVEGADPHRAAPAGLGSGAGRRGVAGAERGVAAPRQAGRRRRTPKVHPLRAPRRLPDAGRGRRRDKRNTRACERISGYVYSVIQ